ncbi:MAG: FMN-binding protein [Mycetocola sp.]
MQIRSRQNVAAALAGIAMVGTLAGCTGAGSASTAPQESPSGSDGNAAEQPSTGTGTEYQDGEYTAVGSYVSPGGPESVTVTLTLQDNTVTALEVTGSGGTPNAKKFQGEFIDGIDEVVVGRNIDELNVSKVSGSSLTSGGFNEALDQIRDDAS